MVNDGSTEDEYYKYDFKKNFGDNFYILHLPRNSRGNIWRLVDISKKYRYDVIKWKIQHFWMMMIFFFQVDRETSKCDETI